ncbi:MAG: helix-turn-helix transcriptional regulator [Planctomycetes bacterium]|nr:helix-turn-helix transcriptional regulator [Planctomycetota bacterium]
MGIDSLSVANRVFSNPDRSPDASQVLVFPFDAVYRPRLDHAAYRELPVPRGASKRQHVHDVYHIVLVTGGKGEFLIRGENIPVRKGLLFLVSPGCPHSFLNTRDETKEYCVVTFEILDGNRPLTWPFHRLMAEWTGRPCREIAMVDAPPHVYQFLMTEIEQLVRIGFAGKTDSALYMSQCLSRILMGLYEHLYCRDRAEAFSSPVLKIREYLRLNYMHDDSLAVLAKIACLNANYLSFIFKRETGLTPVRYRQNLRVHTAAKLLCNSEYPLKQIAELVGFSDIYYFSRMFRKILRVPPGQYRRRIREKQTREK